MQGFWIFNETLSRRQLLGVCDYAGRDSRFDENWYTYVYVCICTYIWYTDIRQTDTNIYVYQKTNIHIYICMCTSTKTETVLLAHKCDTTCRSVCYLLLFLFHAWYLMKWEFCSRFSDHVGCQKSNVNRVYCMHSWEFVLGKKRLSQTYLLPPTSSHAPAGPMSIAGCCIVLQYALPSTHQDRKDCSCHRGFLATKCTPTSSFSSAVETREMQQIFSPQINWWLIQVFCGSHQIL